MNWKFENKQIDLAYVASDQQSVQMVNDGLLRFPKHSV